MEKKIYVVVTDWQGYDDGAVEICHKAFTNKEDAIKQVKDIVEEDIRNNVRHKQYLDEISKGKGEWCYENDLDNGFYSLFEEGWYSDWHFVVWVEELEVA